MQSNKKLILVGVVTFIITTAVSHWFFSQANGINQSKYQKPVSEGGDVADEFAGQPLTEECPINGKMYPKPQREKWEKRRPLGIMVENSTEARPQSGLSSADVIYEAVAEGGITRFLSIYYCENPKIVGPDRSARIYFINLIQGYGEYPLYAHVGGANTDGPADALGEIDDLGWAGYNDLNQFSVPFPNFWRDPDRLPNRATEHTVYTDTNKLWKYAADKRKLSNVDEDGVSWDKTFQKWEFKDDAPSKAPTAGVISFGFWDQFSSDFGVIWKYDPANNQYLRENGGKPHIDKNTNKQLSTKNVVIVMADESVANDGYEGGQHLLYDLTGTGDALIFQNGEVIKGTWHKSKATTRMYWTDENDEEVAIVRGKVWIEILPTGNKVSYGKSISEISKPASSKTNSGTSTSTE